jgi:pimeloyl-ACP methyl ester carboxylesterase
VRSPVDIVGLQFRDAVPGAELVVLERAGHVSNMERPHEFNAHVRRFCGHVNDHTEYPVSDSNR